MDIYFRLLRTESFSAIQTGINSLLDGELDERDMSVYYNVIVVGYKLSSKSLNIGVTFKTLKPVK